MIKSVDNLMSVKKVINDYLSQKSGLQKHIGEDGVVSADITLSDLAIQIGRTEPGKVSFFW